MGRGKAFSEREVGSVIALREDGKSFRDIGVYLGRSANAVSNCWNRHLENRQIGRGGRKSVVTDQAERRVLRAASNYEGTSKMIKANLNLAFSDRTVRRIIQRSEFIVRRKKSRKLILKDHEKARRVTWAQEHLHWRQQWKKIIFSDEKKFRLDGPDGYQHYYHDTRKGKLLRNKRHSGGGGIMVWGAIGWRGMSDLIICEGTMDAPYYQEVLNIGLLDCAQRIGGRNFIFMQDNAPIHTAGSTMAWLDDHNIRVLPWPPRSPDMNPIENVWGRMAQIVYANGKQYASLEELHPALTAAWAEIGADYRHTLYHSVPTRLEEVIDAGGMISLY